MRVGFCVGLSQLTPKPSEPLGSLKRAAGGWHTKWIRLGAQGGRALTNAQLDKVRLAVEPIDYAELRRSTRGKGLHLYLLLMDVLVGNHTEQAALARALLGMLCHDAGLDFAPLFDCLGSNMWIWSRRATLENRGFELLKPATRVLTPDDLPRNWRDHLEVVTSRRTRVFVPGVDEDSFSETAGAYKVALTYGVNWWPVRRPSTTPSRRREGIERAAED